MFVDVCWLRGEVIWGKITDREPGLFGSPTVVMCEGRLRGDANFFGYMSIFYRGSN